MIVFSMCMAAANSAHNSSMCLLLHTTSIVGGGTPEGISFSCDCESVLVLVAAVQQFATCAERNS
jgi:hypothetical protein